MKYTARFYELILDCPFNDPVDDCIFQIYRKMTLSELINATRNLDTIDKKAILDKHDECVRKRTLKKKAS